MIGAALATVVLFFFLRNVVTTLVVSAAIPFSLLATAAMLHFAGRSLNILSMMGLMLAVGMLVDNAVVVLESIHRHRERGRAPLKATLLGCREVTPAVVSSTATSIIVFLPLVLGGRTEITTWIGEVGRTTIFALLCSLFLSPVGPPSKPLGPPASGYQRVLAWTLTHRPATAGIAFGLFALAVAAFIPVDKSTFTASKVESVQMQYQFADNLNYRQVELYVSRIEDWLQVRKDSLHVKSTYSYFSNNEAMTRAYLTTGYTDDEGAEKVRKLLRKGLPQMPGVTLRLRGPNDDDGPSGLSVRIYGEPGSRLDGVTAEVQRRLSRVDGLHDVTVGTERGRQEIEVVADRDRAQAYGPSAGRVGGAVAQFFRGRPLARCRGPDGEVQVQARLSPEDRASLDQLRDLPIASPGGAPVPLGAVADFRTVRTPSAVERQQRRSVVVVRGNCDMSRIGDIRKAVSRTLDSMSFPTGYSWSYGSGFENEDKTQQEMLVNLLLALVLVYLVMAALFESLLHPFAIMFALPFAFIGVAFM